jgi:hypothetical protein
VQSAGRSTLFVRPSSLSGFELAVSFTYLPDLMDKINLASCLLARLPRTMKSIPDPDKHQLTGQPAKRWLIVVARNQPDLYAHLVQAFSHDRKVQVILDRRKDDSRTSPHVTHRLRTHGAVIIRQAQ